MDVAQVKADVELCCPALPLNSRWHIQMCESQKPALLCPAWAALQNCVQNTAWCRRKQMQNCAALFYLSAHADIFKCVNHRNLCCSALRGLCCKSVSEHRVVQAKADTELCCPALPLNSGWHIQTCESQKPALLCPAWAALQNCVRNTALHRWKQTLELCCPALPLNSHWHIQMCESQNPALLCPAWAALPMSQCAPYLTAGYDFLGLCDQRS